MSEKVVSRDEILAMEVGRELDAFVSEHVFGIDATWRHWFEGDKRHYDFMDENHVIIPKYSTDISAAWEVVEKMKQNEWSVTIQAYGNSASEVTEYEVTFGFLHEKPAVAVASAPEAICKAAFLAVMDA